MAENHAGRSPPSSMVLLNTAMFKEKEPVLSFFYKTLSNGITVQSVVLFIIAFFLILFLLLICCVVCCSIGVLRRNNCKFSRSPSSANGKFLDTSYRIFNEQKVHKSRISEDPVSLFGTGDHDEHSPLREKQEEDPSEFPRRFAYSDALPNLYGEDTDDVDDKRSAAPHHSLYVTSSVLMDGAKADDSHYHHSGSSHEMLFPYGAETMFNSSPQMSASQRFIGAKNPDSYFSSTADTSSSLTDTHSTGLNFTRTACESSLQPRRDGSDPGSLRGGGMSRSSHVSSPDVPKMSMQTFMSS
ncbi:hypothetical protein OSTOST_08919 [Ostertagia ostertagi]